MYAHPYSEHIGKRRCWCESVEVLSSASTHGSKAHSVPEAFFTSVRVHRGMPRSMPTSNFKAMFRLTHGLLLITTVRGLLVLLCHNAITW